MDNKARLRAYVERAFRGLPESEFVNNTKEELIADLWRRYDEELACGSSPEAAYNAAIASIGDIFELVDELAGEAGAAPVHAAAAERRRRGGAPAWLLPLAGLAAAALLFALLTPGGPGHHGLRLAPHQTRWLWLLPAIAGLAAVCFALALFRRGRRGAALSLLLWTVVLGLGLWFRSLPHLHGRLLPLLLAAVLVQAAVLLWPRLKNKSSD